MSLIVLFFFLWVWYDFRLLLLLLIVSNSQLPKFLAHGQCLFLSWNEYTQFTLMFNLQTFPFLDLCFMILPSILTKERLLVNVLLKFSTFCKEV